MPRKRYFAHGFFAFPTVCRSDDVVATFPRHTDDQEMFGHQHLSSLSFVVEFGYRLRSKMLAIRRRGMFSAGTGVLCLSNRDHHF